jgi:hypothetical protein
MKVSIFAVLVPAMLVTAIPVAERRQTQRETGMDFVSAGIEARDLTRGQCKNACDIGADAMQKFCRLTPFHIRPFCWAAATAIESPLGQQACISFCDNFF